MVLWKKLLRITPFAILLMMHRKRSIITGFWFLTSLYLFGQRCLFGIFLSGIFVAGSFFRYYHNNRTNFSSVHQYSVGDFELCFHSEKTSRQVLYCSADRISCIEYDYQYLRLDSCYYFSKLLINWLCR